MIVPDLPTDESEELSRICRGEDFSLVQLVAPTTPRERVLRIAKTSTGFLYYVSVTGITGERTELPQDLLDNLRWLRGETDLPVCVGFGISQPEHVRKLGARGRRIDRRFGRGAADGRSGDPATRKSCASWGITWPR